MRYAVVAPSVGIAGSPYVLFEKASKIFAVMCPDKKLAETIYVGLISTNKTTIEKATSKMSYYDISTNLLNDESQYLLELLAKKWKTQLPPELIKTQDPKLDKPEQQ
jgi:hypothetical protein